MYVWLFASDYEHTSVGSARASGDLQKSMFFVSLSWCHVSRYHNHTTHCTASWIIDHDHIVSLHTPPPRHACILHPFEQELIKHVSELKEGKSSIGNEVAIALRSAVLEEELVRGGEVLHPVHIWHGR